MTTLDKTGIEAARDEFVHSTTKEQIERWAYKWADDLLSTADALSSLPAQAVGVKPAAVAITDEQIDEIIEESVIGGTDDYPAINRAGLIADLVLALDALHHGNALSPPSQSAAVGEGENAFAGYEGVTAKELAETVARYGKALSQIDRSWAAAVSGASTDIPNITGWTGSLDNYGQIFAWVARAALRSTP